MPENQVICVLGMHRSGTSSLTGLLEDAGVYLGGVSKENPYNKKGNQENPRIMRLHNMVLEANGGSWDQPPLCEATWSAAQREELNAILEEYAGHPRWAFKDPRSLFTLSAWQESLPQLRYVGTFRHPGAVAQSLYKRGKMPAERSFKLWQRYNTRLLELQAELHFDLLRFDLGSSDYLNAALRAFRRLGLDPDPTTLYFYDEELRSSTIDSQFAVPPADVMATYARLREAAR